MLRQPIYHVALQKELLNHLFKHSRLSIVGTVSCGLLALYILWGFAPRTHLLSWISCLLIISLMRYLHIRQFQVSQPEEDLDRWQNLFVLGAAVSGLIWGLGYVILYPVESITHQVFLVLIIGGLAAGSVSTYSAVPAAVQAFVLSSFTPAAIRIFTQQDEIHIIMGVLFVVFTIIMLISARWTHSFLSQSNQLGIENRTLADTLGRSIHQMDLLREKLNDQISAHEATQNALDQEKNRAMVTLASIGDAVITMDTWLNIVYMNPAAEQLTGFTLKQAIGKDLDEVFQVETAEEREILQRLLEEGAAETLPSVLYHDFTLISRNGKKQIVDTNIAAIFQKGDTPQGMVITFRDISETHLLMQQISHQATHDSLTGLLNRYEFENQLQIALKDTRANGSEHALCYIDLDQFKIVNDSCGHEAGDALLKQLSSLLLQYTRDSDKLGRLGGDEFGLLLCNCSLSKAREIVEYLRQLIRDFRFTWKGKSFEVASSAGLVALTQHTHNINELLGKADLACYAAKDLGRNRVYIYQPEDKELERRQQEIHWASDLTDAIKENRFRLYRQQILPLQANTAPNEQYFEILVRLIDRQGNEVPPGAFIPAAERFNIMSEIDHWIIHNSFRYIAATENTRISINLSGNTLNTGTLTRIISEEAERLSVAPGNICFEITETAAIANLGNTIKTIRSLKQNGFSFALDDFGSGLSSFAYLKNLPVDYLKIDGSFIRNVVNNPVDRAMVSSIHQIADLMGIQTIAEFVESQDIMDVLQQEGIDYAQGYLIGRPEPIELPA